MSWLDPMEPDDALSQLLTDWRDELDAHAGTTMSTELPALPGRSRRWLRAHQRTAAATAIVVALAGSTSVAAAATGSAGPLGPVHDLLYGKPRIDYTAIQVRHILGIVAKGITQARQTGSITAAKRDVLSAQLDTAQQLIDGDAQAPAALSDRVKQLRDSLGAIPAPTPPTPTSPHRDGGHHDTSGGDQPSRSGEDSQGSDDGQGGDRGGSQGSDDGSQDGTDGSGDNTSGGGDQGDQTDNGGSDDGSGSGDQSDGTSSSGDDQTSSDNQSDDGGSVSSDSGDGGGLDGSQAADD